MSTLRQLCERYDYAPFVVYDRVRDFRVAVNFTDPVDRQWAIDHDILLITMGRAA